MVEQTEVRSEDEGVGAKKKASSKKKSAPKRVQAPSDTPPAPKPPKPAPEPAVKLPAADIMPPEEFVATIMAGFVGQQGMQAFSRTTLNALTNPDTLQRMYEGYIEACQVIRKNLE